MNEHIQLTIVLLVVLACAWRAFRRYAPVTAWRLQARVSHALETSSANHELFRRAGRWLRPALPAASAGCGSGCARCGGCDTTPAVDGRTIPLA